MFINDFIKFTEVAPYCIELPFDCIEWGHLYSVCICGQRYYECLRHARVRVFGVDVDLLAHSLVMALSVYFDKSGLCVLHICYG